MLIDNFLLEAAGVARTHDSAKDVENFLLAVSDQDKLSAVLKRHRETAYPFYRFFANYGTGIGETMEEVVALKFRDILPRKTDGKASKAYVDFNRTHDKKHTNYDLLAQFGDSVASIEVKTIRAARSKESSTSKVYEIPNLLEERALLYQDRDKSGNGSFQQTKPDMFDYLLGVVIYADRTDFYLVPSRDMGGSGLKITRQHAGAIRDDGSTGEGHLMLGDLERYRILTAHSEAELLAPDTLEAYLPLIAAAATAADPNAPDDAVSPIAGTEADTPGDLAA